MSTLRFINVLLGICLSYGIPAVQAYDMEQRVEELWAQKVEKAPLDYTHQAPNRIPSQHAVNAFKLRLRSAAALVLEQGVERPLFEKNAMLVKPIASITKLMTAMVVLEAGLPLNQPIRINQADVDTLRHTSSRLPVGAMLTRGELLRLALMSSENRAAAALARTYPGGTARFVAAMNAKAARLGMTKTRFVDASGLSHRNVSTAQDLAKLVRAGYQYRIIREFTTTRHFIVKPLNLKRAFSFRNTNSLIRNESWDIGLSKTGFIRESGYCLVMQAMITGRPFIIVLLDSQGVYSRIGDANRIKQWIEKSASTKWATGASSLEQDSKQAGFTLPRRS